MNTVNNLEVTCEKTPTHGHENRDTEAAQREMLKMYCSEENNMVKHSSILFCRHNPKLDYESQC